MEIRPNFNPHSGVPIYRQLGSYLQSLIEIGDLHAGDRLPPTRELAGQLGLNRTTVSAAYELLETEGLIKGEVGRGSYVCGTPEELVRAGRDALNWARALTASLSTSAGAPAGGVDQLHQFASFGKAFSARRIPRVLPGGSRKPEPENADAARLAGRL